ncbi:MAG TPA: aldo/keto reductase [Acidimicrobiales bacterium]|nr:aldo/keto reductase [Acidimicrobiales bacterium]
MEYRLLGRTGLRVSPLCLGTMNFGTQEGAQTSEADGHAVMDRALELGINFFDTANVYGGGTTEEIIGRWFGSGGGRREKTVIATKVFGGRDPWPNTNRLSARHIRQACDDSLRRLQTDHIDLYQMHHVDRDTPWDEIWQAMDLLVQQGKVIYVGSSNFAGWHIVKANEAAKRHGSLGLVSEQSLYNLNARTVELEVIPACRDYGVGVIPWSPLGGGLLGGALQKVTEGRRGAERVQQQVEAHRPQLEAWEKVCADMGEQPADVALAWLLANPGVTAPIIGPRTMQQLEGPIRSLDITLGADVLAELDKIFPGPGGAAPEAYAW